MEKLNRGAKIYLDDAGTKESAVNDYLSCRDGVVEVYEYVDGSGYGAKTRLFLGHNAKHETYNLIRQTWNSTIKEWVEEYMDFDSDSFLYLRRLIEGCDVAPGGHYTMVRNYNDEI